MSGSGENLLQDSCQKFKAINSDENRRLLPKHVRILVARFSELRYGC